MSRSRFYRPSGFRKTKPVFVVAMEGARTEPIYFRELRPGREAAVRLVLVTNVGHRSSPSDVLARLRDWTRKNAIRKTDEAWIVIDRDAFPEAELNTVCSEARTHGYHIAMSNPCFELWLWLHLRDNRLFTDRHHCQRELAKILVNYEKGDYGAKALIENGCRDAIRRAAALDLNQNVLWPQNQSTWVFRLVQKLLPHADPSP